MIGGNHGHELTVATADLDATTTKVYDIKWSAGHTHSVTLTVADDHGSSDIASNQVTATAPAPSNASPFASTRPRRQSL